MRRPVSLMVVVALGSTLVACGTKDDSAGPGSSTDGGNSDARSVTTALGELPYADPSGSERIDVSTADLERATALAGSKRPTKPDQLVPWAKALNGAVVIPPSTTLGVTSLGSDPEGKALGFTAADVRWFVEMRNLPDRFSVLTLHDDAKLRDDLPTSGGVTTTSKGEPGDITRDPALFAQFVSVNAVAESGHDVAFSTDADQVKDWKADKGRRLDDDASLASIAKALDAHQVYGAELVQGTFAPSGPPGADGITTTFDAVGVGLGREHGQPVAYVSYHFPEDASTGAEQAVEMWKRGTSARTRLPLSEYVAVTGSKTSGDVVTVELEASKRGPQVVLQMLAASDTPFQAG